MARALGLVRHSRLLLGMGRLHESHICGHTFRDLFHIRVARADHKHLWICGGWRRRRAGGGHRGQAALIACGQESVQSRLLLLLEREHIGKARDNTCDQAQCGQVLVSGFAISNL